MKLVQEVIKSQSKAIKIINNDIHSFFSENFTTDTGIHITGGRFNFETSMTNDLTGTIENENVIINGKVLNVEISFSSTPTHCLFAIKCNADITMIGEAKQLEEVNNMTFDSIKLSNIQILDIYTGVIDYGYDGGGENTTKDNVVSNLFIVIAANRCHEFFEKYGITSLKDGTKVDSLSNEDIVAYINQSFGDTDYYDNDDIAKDLFNKLLPDGELIYKFCEDFIIKTINGSTLTTISNINCKDVFTLELDDDDEEEDDDKAIPPIYNQYIIN